MRKICNFIIRFSILGLVFLIPLFFLPWTIEAFDFNKQYLIFFLVSLAFLAWLAKITVSQKKFVLKITPLDLWILVFAAAMIFSAVFSLDKFSSWFGFYGRFSGSIIILLTLIILYFVVVNNLGLEKEKKKKKIGRWLKFIVLLRRILKPENGKRTAKKKTTVKEEKSGVQKKKSLSLNKILRLFLISSGLVIIVAYLSVFGFWAKFDWLPEIIKIRSFNPVSGSLEGLSVFLVLVVSLATGIILQKTIQTKTFRVKQKISLLFNYLLIAAALFLLFLIDFKASWWVLTLTMFILLAMALWTRLFRERVNILVVPIFIFLLSLASLFGLSKRIEVFDNLSLIQDQLPQELILSRQVNNSVVWQAFKEYPVLGSGPGTYLADFARFKPESFNQSRFWNIRFDRGPSHLLEMAATSGVLGGLSYLAVIGIFLLIIFVLFGRRKLSVLTKKRPIWDYRHPVAIIPLFSAWLSLFIGQIFYSQNTVLNFFFWLFLALAVVVWQKIQDKPFKKINFSFDKLPEIGLVANVILLILAFVFVGLFYTAGRFYWAEFKFSGERITSNEQLVENLEKAVVLNKYRESYRRNLSQIYLAFAWLEAEKPQEEQDVGLLQAYVGGAIQQARLVASLFPNSVSAWENLATVYRDSRGLISGALPFAIDAFKKAAELEPVNPIYSRQLCRLNLISEQEEEEEKNWEEIMNYCQRAIDLKSDYLDAHIQLALVYEQKGELERAVKKMEEILERLKGASFQRGSQLAGAAAEIFFQLGRLHFNLNNLEQATRMFEQSVIIMPEYANAQYALALSYQASGRRVEALEHYRIVKQLLPGNEQIEAAIEQIEE